MPSEPCSLIHQLINHLPSVSRIRNLLNPRTWSVTNDSVLSRCYGVGLLHDQNTTSWYVQGALAKVYFHLPANVYCIDQHYIELYVDFIRVYSLSIHILVMLKKSNTVAFWFFVSCSFSWASGPKNLCPAKVRTANFCMHRIGRIGTLLATLVSEL